MSTPDTALRVAQIFRQAHEAKVKIMLWNTLYSYQQDAPYHASFESEREGMEIKGSTNGSDPLETIIIAWEKFESLALRGDRRLLTPQLEASTKAGDLS